MRRVQSFDDVNNVLQELWAWYDSWKSSNRDIDLHGRRFKNVGKHIDSTDFVRWDELPSFEPSITQTIRKTAPGSPTDIYIPITFGYGLGEEARVKDHATPPFIWTNPRKGLAINWFASANLPPVGSGFQADAQIESPRLGIFPAKICTFAVSPGGNRIVYTGAITNLPLTSQFQQGDTVNLMVTSVGSSFGGQDIEMVVLVKLL